MFTLYLQTFYCCDTDKVFFNKKIPFLNEYDENDNYSNSATCTSGVNQFNYIKYFECFFFCYFILDFAGNLSCFVQNSKIANHNCVIELKIWWNCNKVLYMEILKLQMNQQNRIASETYTMFVLKWQCQLK